MSSQFLETDPLHRRNPAQPAEPRIPPNPLRTLDPVIRRATSDDRDFIVGLVPRLFENGVPAWRTPAQLIAGTNAQLERALAEPVLPERSSGPPSSGRSAIFIAERADSRAGFAWVVLVDDFFTGGPVAHISEVVVARSRGGVGRALISACEEWARGRGCELVTLNVLEQNVPARAFYKALGYEPEHTHYAKRL